MTILEARDRIGGRVRMHATCISHALSIEKRFVRQAAGCPQTRADRPTRSVRATLLGIPSTCEPPRCMLHPIMMLVLIWPQRPAMDSHVGRKSAPAAGRRYPHTTAQVERQDDDLR